MKYGYELIFLLFLIFIAGCKNDDPLTDPELEWEIEFLGKPLGDIALHSVTLRPDDDDRWYVTSYVKGLLITRDGGENWETPLTGGEIPVLEIDPDVPSGIFLGMGTDLHFSSDDGRTWSTIQTFPKNIISLLASKADGAIYAGIRWEDSEISNGMYKSDDKGYTWELHSFDVEEDGLIPWDIEEDPVNRKLYVATEIYDHPAPYHPPFFRSSDGGETWEEISGSLPWHVIRIQVHPVTQDVYVLTEGAGLFYSSDYGDHWDFLSNQFWLEFIIDTNNPGRIWGGNHTHNNSSGGVYFSRNSGKAFEFIGLEGEIISHLCLNGNSTALYATAYQNGLYVIRQKLEK